MKFHQIIMYRRVSPQFSEFRQFYVPVEERNGRWFPAGPLREETGRVTQASIFGNLSEYEGCEMEPAGPLDAIPAPAGWTVIASMWLPDNYVPESREVMEERERRAKAYLKRMLSGG